MRIIAGKYGGRTFQSPRTYNTHPMSDKIRGAIFNMLGDIDGLTVLDAFAGSGAIGFEAISRGAQHATLVELDKDAFMTIKKNIQSLGLEESASVVRANIKGWSNNHLGDAFDIVVCDPPYDTVLELLLHRISRHVNDTGTMVVSWPTHEPVPQIPDMELLRHKMYGRATLCVYHHINTSVDG
ncbi:16S rRNA (guanine(966)-N(2))-methyltransferase RsmD [Candidatus Saccharibacteria bacterium]|nr:16S rRNA (guanine(966)-N(2))-methyltransferase RsmD [Candidatus Saccharibacteria bacterium]